MRCDFDFVPAARGSVRLHVSVALELFDEEGVHMVQVGCVSHRCDRRVESYMITSLEIAQFISIQGHSLIGQTQTDISSVHPFTVIQVHLDQNVTAVVHHCHGIIVVHVNPYDVAVPADAFAVKVSLKLRHCLSWTLLEGIEPAIGTVACPGDGSDWNFTEISICVLDLPISWLWPSSTSINTYIARHAVITITEYSNCLRVKITPNFPI